MRATTAFNRLLALQGARVTDAWLAWASRSKLKPFVKLARTIRRYRDGILAAIRLVAVERRR